MKTPAIMIMVTDNGEVSVVARRGDVILEIVRPDSDLVIQLAPGQPTMCIDLSQTATES